MRNKYPGPCYKCHVWVDARAGHFERHKGGWRIQHAECTKRAVANANAPRQALCVQVQTHSAQH